MLPWNALSYLFSRQINVSLNIIHFTFRIFKLNNGFFVKWVRNWGKGYRNQEDSEGQTHQEHQKALQMYLESKFLGLQRTMDPLMAPQVYNIRFCPLISRPPEELLLCIVDFLCDDVVALMCLRIVSRIFLRLINSQTVFWGDQYLIWDKRFEDGHLT